MQKRILALLLAAAVCIMLGSCGKPAPAPTPVPPPTPRPDSAEPFTREDVMRLTAGLSKVEDYLGLAGSAGLSDYHIEYWAADGSTHIECYAAGQADSGVYSLSFFTTEWDGGDMGEGVTGSFTRETFPNELLQLEAWLEYASFSVVPLPVPRGVGIGGGANDVISAYPNRGGDTIPRVLYDVTALNPQAETSWGQFGEELIIGGQHIRNEEGIAQIIYVYSNIEGPDDWRTYDMLIYTLGDGDKVVNMVYRYFTDPE